LTPQAANEQRCPAVAFDGANFLGVWQDPCGNHISDIYGARVAPGGTVLDPDGIIISQAADYQCVPALGFDGANFLVVWTAEQGGRSDIYGARVTPQGTVLDPQGIAISQAANGQWRPTLAFDGANFLVVWEDGRSGAYSDVYGARVSPAGAVLDTAGIVISTAASDQGSPAVAFDGANFLVVWYDSRSGSSYDIYGARVTPQGMVLDPAGFVISQATYSQYYPALAFDGTSFLVVWDDYRGNGYDIYGARVTPQGTVLDSSGIVISQAEDYQQYPAIGFDGTNFLAVWEDYRNRNDTADIYGARVTPQGTVLDPDGIAVSQAEGYQQSPALGFDGADFLVVWEDDRSGGFYSDIYGARVTREGVVFGEGPVISQECGQHDPKLARGSGSQMFLVYCGWAGTVGGKTYNTYRIWGKMDPNPGIEESPKPQASSHKLGATVVRGLLRLSEARGELLDISGRSVLALHSGANDVSRLSPGVYFVRAEPSAVSGKPSAVSVRKVVIQ
jgi:phosphoribosylformylglycinamidine (FGAM) synthase PurS component